MDKNDPAALRNPELTLEALKAVKVCDPACGSGAYLLGMMHELLEQRECLFAVHAVDATKIYDRKLEIIQNNLYGVDIDPFAVNIARLRLWLSLIVDYEGDNPPPLPNSTGGGGGNPCRVFPCARRRWRKTVGSTMEMVLTCRARFRVFVIFIFGFLAQW